MRKMTLTLLGSAFFVLPASVSAADVSQIRCPTAGLSDAEHSALVQYIREGSIQAHPVLGILGRWVERCGAEHGWSLQAREAASAHNIGLIGAAESRQRLVGFGVDVDALERAVIADGALIAAARGGEFPRQELLNFLDRIDDRLREQIVGPSTAAEIGHAAGSYVMYRAAVEASRLNFASY